MVACEPTVRDDVGDSIPPTPFGFGDGYPVETLPKCAPPRLLASHPKFPNRTRSSPVSTQVANKARDREKDRQGPLIQTLDINMDPTEPRRRRCFSQSEKEQINRVRKKGACATCRKKHRKVGKVTLG